MRLCCHSLTGVKARISRGIGTARMRTTVLRSIFVPVAWCKAVERVDVVGPKEQDHMSATKMCAAHPQPHWMSSNFYRTRSSTELLGCSLSATGMGFRMHSRTTEKLYFFLTVIYMITCTWKIASNDVVTGLLGRFGEELSVLQQKRNGRSIWHNFLVLPKKAASENSNNVHGKMSRRLTYTLEA